MGRYSSDSSSESSRSSRQRSRTSHKKSSSRSSHKPSRYSSRSDSESSQDSKRHSRKKSSRRRDMSRSRSHSRRRRSYSKSPSRRRRSHSSSSPHDKYRTSSKSKSSRRSRSRSKERHRESSRSKTDSEKYRSGSSKEDMGSKYDDMSPEDKLKLQLQKALEAAAHADAQLREQGVLAGSKGSTTASQARAKLQHEVETDRKPPASLSIGEQMSRAKTVLDMDAPGFQQQTFTSSRSTSGSKSKSSDSAFGTAGEFEQEDSKSSVQAALRKIPDGLAHDNLYGDEKARQEKWVRKLLAMRQRKANSTSVY